MATRFDIDRDGRRYGPGPLTIAALAGAVFGCLALGAIVYALGVASREAVFGLQPWALIVLGGLLGLMLALNVWVRADARRHGRKALDRLARIRAANDEARHLAAVTARERGDDVGGHGDGRAHRDR